MPYQDKDEAKRLGAEWDPAERRWYLPEGRSLEVFTQWLPVAREDSGVQISAPIYVVESASFCWSCGRETAVIALVLRDLPVAGPYKVEASSGQVYPDLIGSSARRERFETDETSRFTGQPA